MKRILLALPLLFLLAQTNVRAASRWDEMDYGPFLSSSVTMFNVDPEKPEGITLKGITVKFDGGKEAACFDTDMLCYRAGWSGGWLKLMGTPFDGTHRPPEGSRPAPAGSRLFGTSKVEGWARGDAKLVDPRKSLYGPIPREFGHYRGLYVSGDRVVFSYTIGECPVLDMPRWDVRDENMWVFSRTIRMGPSTEPLTLLLSEKQGETGHVTPPQPGTSGQPPLDEGQANMNFASLGGVDAAVTSVPKGARWKVTDGQLALTIPPLKESILFEVRIGSGGMPDFPAVAKSHGQLEDPEKLTHGGPTRWDQVVETKGTLGTGDGAYVVDTLTLPDNNPWHSWMRVGGFDFFPDGKSAAISTWSGDVWVVTGIDDKLEHLKWKRFASGLFQPLGLKIIDGVIHVLGRDQITRLRDLNGDGEADFYENFNNDVEVTPNFHEFAFELNNDPQGNLYYTKGAPLLGTLYFDPIGKNNGCVMRVSKDGSKLDVFATGLRAPNGSSVSPEGLITCSDNQGIWTPSSRINLVKEGGFYGCMGTHHRETPPTTYDVPLCWIPWGLDNSSGGQAWVTSENWGLPKGSLVHLSYGKCKLFQVLWEQNAAGIPQGGVVKFPLNFATGTMRAKFNPGDGQLYVAGLKGWQTDGQQDGALQRVRYTTKPVYTITAAKVTHDGFDLTFTQPLKPESAADLENYAVERWNYLWSKDYGSPEFKVSKPTEQGHDPVEVKSATLSADGRTVSLKLVDMKPVMQMMVKLNVESKDGKSIELEYYATVNWVP